MLRLRLWESLVRFQVPLPKVFLTLVIFKNTVYHKINKKYEQQKKDRSNKKKKNKGLDKWIDQATSNKKSLHLTRKEINHSLKWLLEEINENIWELVSLISQIIDSSIARGENIRSQLEEIHSLFVVTKIESLKTTTI